MEVVRQEIRRGFTVPTLNDVKLVLGRAVVGRVNRHAFDEARHQALQARIDELTASMEESLQHGNYWFRRFENWVAVVRRIGGVYYVATTLHTEAMEHFAKLYGQQQALLMLQVEAQFPPAEGIRPGDLVELNLGPVVAALRDTRLAQFTAAQLATTICRGTTYPGSSRPSEGGRVVLLLDALACVLLEINEDTVDFSEGWRQKADEPGTIIVPLRWDTDTYEKEAAGCVHTPSLCFTITGAVDPQILGPTAFFGVNGGSGMPVVTAEHESYLLTLASDLETRLRAVSM
jgi:hypothetical protein